MSHTLLVPCPYEKYQQILTSNMLLEFSLWTLSNGRVGVDRKGGGRLKCSVNLGGQVFGVDWEVEKGQVFKKVISETLRAH